MNLKNIFKSLFGPKEKPTENISPFLEMADQMFERKDYTNARGFLETLTSINTNAEGKGIVFNNLAACWIENGNYTKAENAAREATKHLENIATLANLGNTQYKLGKYEKALCTYSKLSTTAPKDESADFFLALCSLKLKDYPAATAHFVSYINKCQDAQISSKSIEDCINCQLGNRFVVLHANGARTEITSYGKDTYKSDEKFAIEILIYMSHAFDALGNTARSQECMKAVLSLDKTNQEALALLENSGESCTYIDLGLPSGTLWAKANIGAHDKANELGTYFALRNLPEGIPTFEQTKELIEKCEFQVVFFINGPCKKGWRLTGPNGKHLIFPIEEDNEACLDEAATIWCQSNSKEHAPFMLLTKGNLTLGMGMNPDIKSQARRVK